MIVVVIVVVVVVVVVVVDVVVVVMVVVVVVSENVRWHKRSSRKQILKYIISQFCHFIISPFLIYPRDVGERVGLRGGV